MKTLSITRALAELKMLDKQIGAAINAGEFCALKKKSQKHINGREIESVANGFKSVFDEITDKIAYRQRLKAAVVQANATNYVTIGGNTYTIAQAIDLKNSLAHQRRLRDTLAKTFVANKQEVERINAGVAQAAERDAAQAFGSKQKSSTAEYAQYVEEYKERHEVELVQGFDLEKSIKELDTFLEEFFTEVDFILSEANATIQITIE